MSEDRSPTTSFSRLSDLLALDVVDVDGEVVGHIDDLLLDAREGCIEYVRLAFEETRRHSSDTAGPTGTKRRLLTVPWSAIRIVPGVARACWRIAARRSTLERLARASSPDRPDPADRRMPG